MLVFKALMSKFIACVRGRREARSRRAGGCDEGRATRTAAARLRARSAWQPDLPQAATCVPSICEGTLEYTQSVRFTRTRTLFPGLCDTQRTNAFVPQESRP